jgi:hypothetical protein
VIGVLTFAIVASLLRPPATSALEEELAEVSAHVHPPTAP